MTSAEPTSDIMVRLPRTYDVARLHADLAALQHIQPVAQPGPYHAGEWKGISLRSIGGRQDTMPSMAGLETYQDTEALGRTPYLKEILDSIACPKEVVRILTLPPGGHIQNHFDYQTNFQFGLIRLHVPIVTHPDVEFVVADQRCHWKEGELWYADFSKFHWVKNNSPITRIHMVMDIQINDFILDLFPADFVERRRAEGISLTRKPLESGEASLRCFVCDIMIPARAIPILYSGRNLLRNMKDTPAGVRLIDGKLVVLLDNVPSFALERVGDTSFSIVGLASGCSLDFAFDGELVKKLDLNLHGVPEDLFAARLGKLRGKAKTDHQISLPVV